MWAYVSPVLGLLNFGLSLISSSSNRLGLSALLTVEYSAQPCLNLHLLAVGTLLSYMYIHLMSLNVMNSGLPWMWNIMHPLLACCLQNELWTPLIVSQVPTFVKWVYCTSLQLIGPGLSSEWSSFVANSWGRVSMPAGGVEPTINDTWPHCTIHVGVQIVNPL